MWELKLCQTERACRMYVLKKANKMLFDNTAFVDIGGRFRNSCRIVSFK